MPVTLEQYEKSLTAAPPLCEQLRIRDLLDDVAIQLDGSFVAGYELGGQHSYYASDEMRNRAKNALEALVRSLPERSMRMQVRFEIAEGAGDLVSRYNREQRNESPVLEAIDRLHVDHGEAKTERGCTSATSARIFHLEPEDPSPVAGLGVEEEECGVGRLSLSASKCIERTRREHEDLARRVQQPDGRGGSDAASDRHGHAANDPRRDFPRGQTGAQSTGLTISSGTGLPNGRSSTRARAARWQTSTSRMKRTTT